MPVKLIRVIYSRRITDVVAYYIYFGCKTLFPIEFSMLLLNCIFEIANSIYIYIYIYMIYNILAGFVYVQMALVC